MSEQPLDNSPLHPADPREAQRFNRLFFGALTLIVLVAAGFAVFSLLDTPPEVDDDRLQQEAVLGNDDAVIEMIEWGTYGCQFCRFSHQSGIIDDLLNNYPQVEFRFRNWPVRESNDPEAAEAAQCALDQSDEAFWSYHEALFDLSNSEYRSFETEDFVDLADEIGLDADALASCLEDRTHERTIEHWQDIAEDINLIGTPTFFVNGQRVNNAAQLESVINALLSDQT